MGFSATTGSSRPPATHLKNRGHLSVGSSCLDSCRADPGFRSYVHTLPQPWFTGLVPYLSEPVLAPPTHWDEVTGYHRGFRLAQGHCQAIPSDYTSLPLDWRRSRRRRSLRRTLLLGHLFHLLSFNRANEPLWPFSAFIAV
jgi:hypothetical protein